MTTTRISVPATLVPDRCDLCQAPTDDSALCERCAPLFEAARRLDPDEVIVETARAIAQRQHLGQVTATDVDCAIPLALAALRVVTDRVSELVDLIPALAAAEGN